MTELNEMAQFWMVYGVDQGAPTVRHKTEREALREAERLANACPGKVFVVLEAMQAVRKVNVERFYFRSAPQDGRTRDLDDDKPF